MASRPSHQRRPDTFRATTPEGVFLIDSTRPITHAVIATRKAGPESSSAGYIGAEAAERAAKSLRCNDFWDKVEVVALVVPWTTGGRPQMTAEEFHAARALATAGA